jgi:DNA-binding NarL/FixJ family response regulator
MINIVIADSNFLVRTGLRSVLNQSEGYQIVAEVTNNTELNEALVDVASAKAGVPYTAIVNLPDSPLNFEAGYRQGSNAGSVTLQAPIVVAQGQLIAE